MTNKLWATALVAIVATIAGSAHAGLDTTTYIDSSGGAPNNAGRIPSGSVSGDTTGVGAVTLTDVEGGDMWNGGDQFIYLHEGTPRSGDWTATVRVVSQTAAIDGRWGKAGIHARNSLDGNAANAMAQLAAGNGSQVDAPASGDHSPVPVRIAGRTQNDGNGGFEIGIPAAAGTEQDVDSDGNIANNTFQSGGTVATWLSLSYTSATNEFVAGTALDVGGSPGVWSFSDAVSNVPASDPRQWYVGLAYSAHNDLVPVDPDGFHGVTYDSFSIVPEPSTLSLLGLALLGFMARMRHRRR